MSYLIAIGVLLILWVIYWVFIRDPRYDKSVVMPYFDLPIVGNTFQLLFNDKQLECQLELVKKYGSYYTVIPIVGLELIYCDPESIEFVLNDPDLFILSPVRNILLSELFGNGIFMSNGERWKTQRDLARPIFSNNMRVEMYNVYYRCSENLLKVLNEAYQTKQVVDIQTLFKRFTLDTFGEIGFGYKIDSLIKPIPFSESFDWILTEIEFRFRNPYRRYVTRKLWYQHIKTLDDFVYKIIEERKSSGYEGKTDYLSTLLSLEASGEAKGITQKFLRDQLINFFIAGRDTTAVLLTWTYYFLSLHPEVEKKVRQEILEVLGDEKPTMQNSKQLKYTQMVFDESLRLYPPAVPFNAKMATEATTLPNGVKISKGQTVLYSPWTVHHLEKYWGKDADQFRPERWEDPLLIKHPYQFVPFQKGPRICLGMNMAYEEAKCCIAILMQNGIHFELQPNQNVTYATSAILSAKHGMLMSVNKI